jgi:NAD(P)-dependent dehydrogenase (short-subunit alcohol dehydrogenase family)
MNATDSKKVAGGRFDIGKFFEESIKEFVETFNRTNKQTIDLFEKRLSVYQATSVLDAQRRVHDIIESSLSALQVNVDSALKSKALKVLTETFDEYVRTLSGALDLKRTARGGINIEEPSLDRYKVGTLEAPSGGAVNMRAIEAQVAVITGAAGGIGHALALDMARRGAAGMALVDFSDRVVQVAREINTEAGRQVAIAYRGDTTDSAFRQAVYADITRKAGVPRICVPAAAITKDALAVRIDKQTGRVVIYPVEDFRKVVEINMIAPVYWAIELVAAVAKDRASRGLKRWQPEEGLQGAVVFLGSIASAGNVGQISYSSTKAGLEGAASTLMAEAMYYGVRCSVIHPGFTDTPMVQALGEEYIRTKVLPQTQLKRLIKPEEIADAICFMLTNAAVSGELWADAGWRPAA